MKNNNSSALFFMKSDILNIHLTNTIHRINESIKNQSYTANKFRMLSKFGPESWALWAVVLGFLHCPMTDCCNALLQIPKRDILLSFEHKSDHIVSITKMIIVMFHETASRK